MQPERPHLVGLVCWVLIISGMVGIYYNMKGMSSPAFNLMLQSFPYPSWLAETILFGTFGIAIVCGILMYEGHGWARYVYFAIALPYFVQNYLVLPQLKEPDLWRHILEGEFVFFLISVGILFIPKARYFFHPPKYIDE